MRKFLCFSILIFALGRANAQYTWQNVKGGLGNSPAGCEALLNDTIDNRLYAGGTFTVMDDSIDCSGIAIWDGANWSTNTPFIGAVTITALTLFQGKLFDAGFNGVGYYDSGAWHNAGLVNGTAYCLTVYHNKLYVGGDFTNVNGIGAHYIACYDGTNWSGVGGGLNWSVAPGAVWAMNVWNDKLYVGGAFDQAVGLDSVNSIAAWNDTSWSKLGTGLFDIGTGDATAYVWSICSYKNYLYVGGEINSAGGLPVNGICRWNDTTWNNVGIGLDGFPEVYSMLVKDSSLYVGGLYEGAGGVPNTYSLARWDDNNWNSVGGSDLHNGGQVFCLAEYENELYIGGSFGQIGNVFATNIAKYGYYNSVSEVKENEYSLYPNPANEKIIIENKNIEGNEIKIKDVTGRILLIQKLKVQTSTTIDISSLFSGIYFLEIKTKDAKEVVKKFVKL